MRLFVRVRLPVFVLRVCSRALSARLTIGTSRICPLFWLFSKTLHYATNALPASLNNFQSFNL